ncbi:MAG: lipopolysaccharide kinase InaA family protein [Gemmatimonadaceae bacterium]
MMVGATPAGYVRVTAGRCAVIAREDVAGDVKALLEEGSLYEAAARNLGARMLQGRGVSYAIALPVTGARVVVRRNRHGGLFAPLTRDLFLPPTRAPYELEVALRLIKLGVRTPPVLMYGIERVHGILRRADVVTSEIGDGRDMSTYMHPNEDAGARERAWSATRALVRALNAAGARHHDLNVKNILIAPARVGLEAWVLDVDRVELGRPDDPAVRDGNVARLLRSARKWRDERGAVFDEREVAAIAGRLPT